MPTYYGLCVCMCNNKGCGAYAQDLSSPLTTFLELPLYTTTMTHPLFLLILQRSSTKSVQAFPSKQLLLVGTNCSNHYYLLVQGVGAIPTYGVF